MSTRVVSKTIDLKTPMKDVSEYITEINNNGIRIHPKNESGATEVQLDGTGMKVIDAVNEVSVAEFGVSGAQIGQTTGAHTTIDEDGMQVYSVNRSNDIIQLANIGYGEGNYYDPDYGHDIRYAPYYTLGIRQTTAEEFDPSETYNVGSLCVYNNKIYVCKQRSHRVAWNPTYWKEYIGNYSNAEGYSVIASGYASHAEGEETAAIGDYSHAEGQGTIAIGFSSHAEGAFCQTDGDLAHAEGQWAWAKGDSSHAGGWSSEAVGVGSFAHGMESNTNKDWQTVIGTYNIKDNSSTTIHRLRPDLDFSNCGEYAFIIGNGIGNGTSGNARSNALTVDWNGKISAGDYSGNFKSLFDIFYPVGSYYETSLPSDIPSGESTPTATDMSNLGLTWFHPKYAWGGTWELEASGNVHVSSGTGYALGSVGGSPYIQAHTHNHTNPSVTGGSSSSSITGGGHVHDTMLTSSKTFQSGTNKSGYLTGSGTKNTGSQTHTHDLPSHTHTVSGGSVGAVSGLPSGQSTGSWGNMPPYIVVNRWHRTA